MANQAFESPERRVAIVGLGPVGALLAQQLGARGTEVTVFERAAGIRPEPRAAHLDDDALRILQAAGLADEVAEAGRVIDGMDIVDARGRRLVRARKPPSAAGWPAATLVHQPELEAALRERLAGLPTVELRTGHAVEHVDADDGGVTIHAAGPDGPSSTRAAWLVGCDGARSTVRQLMGIKLRHVGRPYSERWLVVDALVDDPAALPDRLVQFADPRQPATYVPFAGRRRRWEFRLHPNEDAEAIKSPDAVADLLRPHLDPNALEVERTAVYTFGAAVAARWRAGRVLLAGDAAHVMPPFIGQGLCSGLRDAAFLGWALAAVVQGDADESLLDAYEAERRPHAGAAARFSARAGRFIGAGGPAAGVRDTIIGTVRRIPVLRRRLDDYRPRVPRFASAIAGEGVRDLQALPQPWVITPEGRRARLDDVLGAGWSVIGLGLDPRSWAGHDPTWRNLAFRFVRVLPDGAEGADGMTVREEGDALARWAAQRWPMPVALVVRPDRFLFGAYRADAGPAAAADLRRVFGPRASAASRRPAASGKR